MEDQAIPMKMGVSHHGSDNCDDHIQQLTEAKQARSCDVTHDLTAVVFSTARFAGNLFHAYTDDLPAFPCNTQVLL
jgi:hypothetical protein